MGNVTLQLHRTIAGTLAPTDIVIFDTIIFSDGNISYNSSTGIITFLSTGRYLINWSVASHSSLSSNGIVFALSSSQNDFMLGNSPAANGEATGSGILNVASAPVTLFLASASASNITLSSIVPVKASLTVTDISPGDLSNTSLCFSYAQLSHIIGQLITLYPSSVMSVFTTNINVVTGTPYQLYASPEAADGGLFVLTNSNGQYESLPLCAITAIYTGENTVYNQSITYLPAPSPLPGGCDTSLLAAIRDYLPPNTEVALQLGVTTQASGAIYRNEYGILVLSDSGGNTPIFIAPAKIARIVTEPPSSSQQDTKVSITTLS